MILVILSGIVPVSAGAQTQGSQGDGTGQPKRVLILNSYHAGMPFSDEEVRGIRTTLPPETEIFVEYMDTKRLRDASFLTLLKEIYTMKYGGKRFDLIFSLDDDALLFLLAHAKSIFADIPVVFCGVNSLRPGMLDDAPLFTGVVETMDIAATLKIGLELYPQARQILAVTDRSTTGASNRALLEQIAASGQIGRPIVFLDEGQGLDLPELIDKLRKSSGPSLVYHADFFQDKNGHALNPETVMPLVSENAPGPVLVHGGMYMGHGALGGKVNSGYYQGVTAAGLAQRIWKGEKPASIPVIRENINAATVDYHVMKRWGIPANIKISEEIEIMNRPEEMWHGYGRYLLAALAFIILEGLLILWLLRLLRQQRLLRSEAAQSEARFRRLFDLTPIPLYYVLEDGGMASVNQAFTNVLGYTREDVPTLDVWRHKAYPDPVYRNFVAQTWDKAGLLDPGRVVEPIEFRVTAKDGSERVMLISANALDRNVIASLFDITEHKKMQEMMVQTEKMISVGGISAGIAHEINNPLGIVVQAVQTLAQRMRPDFAKNQEAARLIGLDLDLLDRYSKARKLDIFIADIQSAALRAASITRHMLDFSRISESRRTVCNLPVIIEKALALASNDFDLKKSFDFKRIRISKNFEGCVPNVNCTETEIEQVVLNLLRNSAQAMGSDQKDPHIDIRLSKHADSVRLEIADNGPGIPNEIQRRIFEPFFTTKAPGVGTGLGLSVSYFIITKGHGGKMSVESTPGLGSAFTIDLPMHACPEAG